MDRLTRINCERLPSPKRLRVVIGASAGESFVAKMQRRGIEAVLTAEPDPAIAIADYARHKLAPRPRSLGGMICRIRDVFSSHQ